MSQMQALKQARQDNVLDRLKKGPMTLQEIAEHTGSSYHTARNDVAELIRSGYVSATGGMRNGASTYQAGTARPMPMVYHKASAQNHPVTSLGESYARNIGETSSSRAALEVPQIAAELMYLVALHVSEGHPNHATLKQRMQAVAALRLRLANAYVHLETITDMASQMLEDNRLWSASTLEEIAADPLFNPEKSILAHETILNNK